MSTTHLLEECLKLIPSSNSIVGSPDHIPPILFVAGILQFDRGNYKEATTLFQRCAEEKKQYAIQSMNMLGILSSLENHALSSVQWFQAASQITGELTIGILYNLSIQLSRMKNLDAEHRILEYIWKQLSDKCEAEDNKLDNALLIPSSKKYLRDSPPLLEILYRIGHCAVGRKDYEFANGAFSYLFDIIMNGKDSDKFKKQLQTPAIEVVREYIYVLLQFKEYAKAESIADHLLHSYPDDVSVQLSTRVHSKLNIPQIQTILYKCDSMISQEKDVDLCLQVIESALKQKITDAALYVECLNNRAMLWLCKNETRLAIRDLENAISFIQDQYRPQLSTSKTDEEMSTSKNLGDKDVKLIGSERTRRQSELTYNLCLLYLDNGREMDAYLMWFHLRNIPVNQSSEYYDRLMEKLQHQQLQKMLSNNQKLNRQHNEDNNLNNGHSSSSISRGATTTVIEGHVMSEGLTVDHMHQLDIEMLYMYRQVQ